MTDRSAPTVRGLLDRRGDLDRLDAEVLLAEALGRGRSWLFAHGDDPVSAEVAQRFGELCEQRRRGLPVAYLTGHREFWSLKLHVSRATLIPRPDTEILVEQALERLPPRESLQVLDLGTGSGAIALAIASERGACRVTGIDASADALACARVNASALGLAGRCEWLQGSWFEPLHDRRFDLIVSNPPYIATNDPHLNQGDVAWEPRAALVAGDDGLDALRPIIGKAPAHLENGGWLLVEHGQDQGTAVAELFRRSGFRSIETCQDLEQRPRVTAGQVPQSG